MPCPLKNGRLVIDTHSDLDTGGPEAMVTDRDSNGAILKESL